MSDYNPHLNTLLFSSKTRGNSKLLHIYFLSMCNNLFPVPRTYATNRATHVQHPPKSLHITTNSSPPSVQQPLQHHATPLENLCNKRCNKTQETLKYSHSCMQQKNLNLSPKGAIKC